MKTNPWDKHCERSGRIQRDGRDVIPDQFLFLCSYKESSGLNDPTEKVILGQLNWISMLVHMGLVDQHSGVVLRSTHMFFLVKPVH